MGSSAAPSSYPSMADRRIPRSISSMTERNTSSLLCCGILLLPFLIDRRKPDYSGAVDNVAVRIETRSMTRTIPTLLGVVPAHDAIEMGADGRMLVDGTALVAVDGDFSPTTTNDCALAGL